MSAEGKILLRGLKPFDPTKHERFPLASSVGFTFNKPTYPIKRTGGLTSFGMFGNGPDNTLTVNGGNPCGNCGFCGFYHVRMMAAAFSGEAVPSFTANEVVTDYFTYMAIVAQIAWRPPPVGTPWSETDVLQASQIDDGVDLGDMLLWKFQQGDLDGFVALQLDEVDAALSQFGSIIAGWVLTDQTDDDFNRNVVADVGPGNEPDPRDGHCMPIEAVDMQGGYTEANTWAGSLRMTSAYRQACLQQAFLVLTKEQAAAHNFPLQQTETILKDLGGQAV